jgi:hypothetical protein
MADEGTLGLARASDYSADDLSKAELQRRMDEARDSISQTVTEIKDTVVHQYEAVKETINDTLDWREQVKKRPVAWSLGAAGGGFLIGYTIAAIVKGNSSGDRGQYASSEPVAYAARPIVSDAVHKHRENEKPGPGLLERFQQTEAYDHLQKEVAAVGSRFVGELSQTAQEVVLPAAVSWFRKWLTGLVPETNANTASINQDPRSPRVDWTTTTNPNG